MIVPEIRKGNAGLEALAGEPAGLEALAGTLPILTVCQLSPAKASSPACPNRGVTFRLKPPVQHFLTYYHY
jgi:hypothetical protein